MKRWFSVLLVIILTVSMSPINSMADELASNSGEKTAIVTEAPVTDAPAADAPAADAPAADAPAADAPAADAPAADAPDTDAPATDAPVTDAPATDAPVTDAPVTDAPVTDAPVTDAPDAAMQAEKVTVDLRTVSLDKPMYLTAVSASMTSVYISWQAVSSGSGYSLEMSTNTDFAGTTTKTISGITTNNYTWTSLTCGTKYYFRIRSMNNATTPATYSSYSDTINTTPSPSAPSTFTATAVSVTSVKLSWTKVSGVTGYYLKRDGTTIATLNVNTLAYTDTALVCGTKYAYSIVSYLGSVESIAPAELTYTAKPPVPASFKATSQDINAIKLTWGAISDLDGYIVYRSRSGASGTFDLLTTITSASTSSYVDADSLAPGSTYYYYIVSYVTLSSGKMYSELSATISCIPLPPTPDTFSGKSRTDTSIRVYWSKVNTATAYNIYCSEGKNGTYTKVGSRVTTLLFTHSGLTVGTPYYYYVKALVLVGDTEIESNPTTTIMVIPLPAAPSVTLTNIRYDRIQLDWTASVGASGYLIYRNTTAGGTYTLLQKTDASTQTYISYSLTCGTTYYYKIRAYLTLTDGTIYYGPYSTVQNAQATLPGSTSVTRKQMSSTSIRVYWNAVAYAQAYRVSMSTNGGALVGVGVISDPSNLKYTVTGLTPGNTYRFMVYAIRYVNNALVYGVGIFCTEIQLMPTQPTDLVATALSSTSLNLSWTAVGGVTGYIVNGSSSNDPDYTLEQYVSSANLTITGLKTGLGYNFTVTAYATVAGENLLGPVSAVYATGAKPSSPTTITAVAQTSTSIVITWSKVSDATGYEVYRLDPGASRYNQIYDVTVNDVLTYTDNTGLQVGLTYRYYVLSYVNVNGTPIESNKSTIAKATPVTDAPDVTSQSVTSTSIKLTWGPLSGATGYQVLSSTSANGTYSPVTTTTGVTATITNLTTGATVYYKVRGYVDNGSARVFGTLSTSVQQAAVLVAPQSLYSKKNTTHAKQVKLYWSAVAGAAGYKIYRSDSNSGTYSLVGTTNSNSSVTYTNAGLVPGKTYYYKVAGYSTYSGKQYVGDLCGAIAVTTFVDGVSNFNYTATSVSSVKLTWTATIGADGYYLYSSNTVDGTFSYIGGTSGAGSVSYTVSNMSLRTSRYFKIRAYGYGVNSTQIFGDYSAALDAKSNVLGPGNLKLVSAGTTKLEVTWTASTGANGYIFYIATKGGAYQKVATLQDTDIQSYIFTGLNTKTTYYIKIAAFYLDNGGNIVTGGNSKLTAATK